METTTRREKKKRKKLDLKMKVLCETADHMSPIVGYFPSGYDPVAEGSDPDVKIFRNKKQPKRLQLVVHPSDSNVEFVGKSYAGEAAITQFSTYTVGVLDKETQILKIIPIAENKIFRLEPRVINTFGGPPDAVEGIIDEKQDHNMLNLANLYGTKKFKNALNKYASVRQKKDDPSALELLAVGTDDKINDETLDAINEPLVRNIPPYDSSAETQENAYPLHKIILKEEMDCLNDILETLESISSEVAQDPKFWSNNHYPCFVFRRLSKLRSMKDEKEKSQLACILSYITHLINFRKVAANARWKDNPKYTQAKTEYKIPPIVYNKFMMLFLDPASNVMSTERSELLTCYILVLTLFADNFNTDTTDIEQDLAMTSKSLWPYFMQLGCVFLKGRRYTKPNVILPVPLVFKDLKKRRRSKPR